MTDEQKSISRRNRDKAREYFGITGNFDLVLHHTNPEWKHCDISRYIQWNVEDLQVLTRTEHMRLHQSGENNSFYGKKHTQETRTKISNAISGENNGMYGVHRYAENNPMFGKKHSEETRRKISEAFTGRHWYNNGEVQVQAFECPDGFVKGRLKNGTKAKS